MNEDSEKEKGDIYKYQVTQLDKIGSALFKLYDEKWTDKDMY